MTPDDLPNLKDWLNVEIWTIEEAAMLWAAIDPYEHPGSRITEIKSLVHSEQHRKAMICQRAILEAVCSGTLPFSRAVELHNDHNGDWEKEVSFPDTPDPEKIIPHKTRITQAAFLKWVKGKNIPSYRSLVIHAANKASKSEMESTPYIELQKPVVHLLAAPTYMDAEHPMSPEELRAANDAWHAVTKDGDPRDSGKAIRTALRKYLDEHPRYSALSNEAKERICTVTNWNRKGGAPRTPT